MSTRRVLSVFVQAAYPWFITFGLMGLFHRYCPAENATMRYLSDSAYWLYLTHLPLIIGAQLVVKACASWCASSRRVKLSRAGAARGVTKNKSRRGEFLHSPSTRPRTRKPHQCGGDEMETELGSQA